MHCPFCQYDDTRVIDTRTSEDGGTVKRRRQCAKCGRRFTTQESATVIVVKRSGATEPFAREKIIGGVRKACQGRPVSDDSLALLAHRVEETLRMQGNAQVATDDIGLAILEPLRALDEVAYLRFASVYQCFETLEDFERVISNIRAANHSVPRCG